MAGGATLHPTLFSPVSLGPVTLPNRVVSTSHQTGLVHGHLPTDELIAYHRARAAGGAGGIFLEATAVHPTGLLTAHTLGGYLPEIAGGYRRLADAVHEHGTGLFVQLFHGGREQISSPPRPPAVAPSAVPSARFKSEPRALSVRELGELIDGYAASARLARDGGLDGIELSFAHGYLAAQFFAPISNRRSDGYNGDLEARLRFAREVIEAVRAAAGPDLAVGARLAANELGEGLLGTEACAEIAAALTRDGALDFVSFALGYSATYAAATWIAPPAPAEENAITLQIDEARAAVAPTPVIATTRVVDLDAAERAVAGGQADAVGMTRALIADPDLVAKARGAATGPVIECVSCNEACIGHYHAGVPIACAVNVRTGRERSLRAATRLTDARRVLVVGGGPAGVAAAIEAASWGDEVELRERRGELGGQLRLAGTAPAHGEMWTRWSRTMDAQLKQFGVTIELDAEVAGPPPPGEWDLIVLATGARPYAPPLPPLGETKVVSSWAAIADPRSLTGPVLVADWGADWAGLDAAEMLRDAGHEVTLACAALHPGESLHQYQRSLYLARLDAAGVAILHHTELASVDGSVEFRNVFSRRPHPLASYGTIVLAQGREPEDGLWSELEDRPEAVRAGDILSPRGLEEATLEGALAAYRG